MKKIIVVNNLFKGFLIALLMLGALPKGSLAGLADEIRKCPDQVSVTGIEIQANQYLNVPPGFLGTPIGNESAKLPYFNSAKDAKNVCYCNYGVNGTMARLKVNTSGYADCDVDMYNQILLFK